MVLAHALFKHLSVPRGRSCADQASSASCAYVRAQDPKCNAAYPAATLPLARDHKLVRHPRELLLLELEEQQVLPRAVGLVQVNVHLAQDTLRLLHDLADLVAVHRLDLARVR